MNTYRNWDMILGAIFLVAALIQLAFPSAVTSFLVAAVAGFNACYFFYRALTHKR